MMTEPDEHGRDGHYVSRRSADMLDSLLAQYVSGVLPQPVAALVRAHLEIRLPSRRLVEGLEEMAGSEFATLDPAELDDRDAMIGRILRSGGPAANEAAPARTPCPIMPRALQDFTGYRADDIPWRTKLPGFRECKLGEFEGLEAELLWIRAGRAMPSHTHEGSELTLVLEGGFSDAEGHYLRGDICAADESVDHRPVADEDGPCICFAITTAPLKLTGSMRQLFSDIFGR